MRPNDDDISSKLGAAANKAKDIARDYRVSERAGAAYNATKRYASKAARSLDDAAQEASPGYRGNNEEVKANFKYALVGAPVAGAVCFIAGAFIPIIPALWTGVVGAVAVGGYFTKKAVNAIGKNNTDD